MSSSLPQRDGPRVVPPVPASGGLCHSGVRAGRLASMTTALITGANKGIGLETARQLGERGLTVLVGARDADRGSAATEELRAGGADAHWIALDVADEASALAAAATIEREHGGLDVLVNNAGIAQGDGTGRPSET